jgi:hypothetical protein
VPSGTADEETTAMAMLVNRSPIAEDTLAALKSHCEYPECVFDTIPADDLDADGQELLRGVLVEGEPADGITLHGTRWGRQWCAYLCVD